MKRDIVRDTIEGRGDSNTTDASDSKRSLGKKVRGLLTLHTDRPPVVKLHCQFCIVDARPPTNLGIADASDVRT